MAAVLRRLRRLVLCRSNPCTSLLVVSFIASVLFLISAITRNNISSLTHVGHRADDPNLRTPNKAIVSGMRRRHRNGKTGSRRDAEFIVVGGDDVQVCQMTRKWTNHANSSMPNNAKDRENSNDRKSMSGAIGRSRFQRWDCDVNGGGWNGELFYVDLHDKTIRVNSTWLRHHQGFEPVACHYRVVTRGYDNNGKEYAEYSEPRSFEFPQNSTELVMVEQHEFVHIDCRLVTRKHSAALIRNEMNAGVSDNVQNSAHAVLTAPRKTEQATKDILGTAVDEEDPQVNRHMSKQHWNVNDMHTKKNHGESSVEWLFL